MRLTSLVTLVFFLTSQITFANPGAGIEIAANREVPGFLRIDIPADLASLDGIWEAAPSTDSKVILHIQNAHANYGAQKKIQSLLAYLNKTYAIKTIFVEGAAEDLNADYLKLFPDKARNLELADLLAQQGELTGAELFILDQDNDKRPETTDQGLKVKEKVLDLKSPVSSLRSDGGAVKAIGIESAALYRQNYEALKKVFGAEALVNRYLKGYESLLEGLSSKIFSKDLRRVLSDWQKFEKGHREFMPYIRSLTADAKRVLNLDLESLFAQVEWPQITRLLVLQGMEKDLDTAKALEEKARLLIFLKSRGVSSAIIAEVENFREQRMSLRQGQGDMMEPRDVLEALIKEAGPKGFNFRDYPAFSLYAGYLTLKSELDAKGLFEEIKTLFENILDRLAETSRQKVLLELYRDEELARKLLSLELSRGDWKAALARGEQVGMDSLVSRLKELSGAVSQEMKLAPSDLEVKTLSPKFREGVLGLYTAAFDFYEFAHQREAVFYEKIHSVMGEGASSKAVLITGGFHTDGMTDLFREHNISYGILTPRLMEKSDEKLYRNTMLQNEEQLFTISTLELAIEATKLSTTKTQGFDAAKRLGPKIKNFWKMLGADKTGREVAEAFNNSPEARSQSLDGVTVGISLVYLGQKKGKAAFKLVAGSEGNEKILGEKPILVNAPAARSEGRVPLDQLSAPIQTAVTRFVDGWRAYDENLGIDIVKSLLDATRTSSRVAVSVPSKIKQNWVQNRMIELIEAIGADGMDREQLVESILFYIEDQYTRVIAPAFEEKRQRELERERNEIAAAKQRIIQDIQAGLAEAMPWPDFMRAYGQQVNDLALLEELKGLSIEVTDKGGEQVEVTVKTDQLGTVTGVLEKGDLDFQYHMVAIQGNIRGIQNSWSAREGARDALFRLVETLKQHPGARAEARAVQVDTNAGMTLVGGKPFAEVVRELISTHKTINQPDIASVQKSLKRALVALDRRLSGMRPLTMGPAKAAKALANRLQDKQKSGLLAADNKFEPGLFVENLVDLIALKALWDMLEPGEANRTVAFYASDEGQAYTALQGFQEPLFSWFNLTAKENVHTVSRRFFQAHETPRKGNATDRIHDQLYADSSVPEATILQMVPAIFPVRATPVVPVTPTTVAPTTPPVIPPVTSQPSPLDQNRPRWLIPVLIPIILFFLTLTPSEPVVEVISKVIEGTRLVPVLSEMQVPTTLPKLVGKKVAERVVTTVPPGEATVYGPGVSKKINGGKRGEVEKGSEGYGITIGGSVYGENIDYAISMNSDRKGLTFHNEGGVGVSGIYAPLLKKYHRIPATLTLQSGETYHLWIVDSGAKSILAKKFDLSVKQWPKNKSEMARLDEAMHQALTGSTFFWKHPETGEENLSTLAGC